MKAWMLAIGVLSGCAEQAEVIKTVEVVASVNCKTNCVAVTRAFVEEHFDLMAENIKLTAAWKVCRDER